MAAIWDSVINDTEEREKLNKWYLKYFVTNFGWEALFKWDKMTQFNMSYRRKHPPIFKTGNILLHSSTIGKRLNAKLTYSEITYQNENIIMDETFTFARQISKNESSLVPGLLKQDLLDGKNIEANHKRIKILKTLQNPNAIASFKTSFTKDMTRDEFLSSFDDFIEECGALNINVNIILCNSTVFRLAKKYMQLETNSNEQVNKMVDGKGNEKFYRNSIKTVEGYSLYYMLPKYEILNEEGNIFRATSLNVKGQPVAGTSVENEEIATSDTYMIAIDSSPTEENISLRVNESTPLRIGVVPVGVGTGAQIAVEWVKEYGSGIKEPKKFVIALSDINKKNLQDAKANYSTWIDSTDKLNDFKTAVIRLLSTNQGFWNITGSDIDFFEADGATALDADYLTNNNSLGVTIKANSNSTYFTGTKLIYLNNHVVI